MIRRRKNHKYRDVEEWEKSLKKEDFDWRYYIMPFIMKYFTPSFNDAFSISIITLIHSYKYGILSPRALNYSALRIDSSRNIEISGKQQTHRFGWRTRVFDQIRWVIDLCWVWGAGRRKNVGASSRHQFWRTQVKHRVVDKIINQPRTSCAFA